MKPTLLILLALTAAELTAPSKDLPPPNFLIILTDDQGWTGTSLKMNPAIADSKSDYFHTPRMDALMSAGMRFTDGYASGAWCTPTRRCIQSGLSTSRHIFNEAKDGGEALVKGGQSIPRVLKAANAEYVCAHFGKWHLDYDSLPPAALGYDVSDGDTTNANGEMPAAQRGAKVGKARTVPDVWEDPKRLFTLTQRAGDFIETQTKAHRPWFAQLSHYAVHLTISYRQTTLDALKDRPLGQKHAIPEYAAMTEDLDDGIGQLMDRLKALGVLENTFIIFLSDNGGRGKLPIMDPTHQPTLPMNYPLAESKHSIYEGGLRVPFAISGPGIVAGGVSQVPVSGMDLLPTLADLAGRTLPVDATLDGGSLKPLLLGQGTAVQRHDDFIVFESEGRELPRHTPKAKRSDYKAALRQGSYKLVKFYGGAGDGQTELYDLSKDIGEEKNLATEQPEIAAKLNKALDDYLARVGGLRAEVPGSKKRHKGENEN